MERSAISRRGSYLAARWLKRKILHDTPYTIPQHFDLHGCMNGGCKRPLLQPENRLKPGIAGGI